MIILRLEGINISCVGWPKHYSIDLNLLYKLLLYITTDFLYFILTSLIILQTPLDNIATEKYYLSINVFTTAPLHFFIFQITRIGILGHNYTLYSGNTDNRHTTFELLYLISKY